MCCIEIIIKRYFYAFNNNFIFLQQNLSEYIKELRSINVSNLEINYDDSFYKIALFLNENKNIDTNFLLENEKLKNHLIENKNKHIYWYKGIEKKIHNYFKEDTYYKENIKTEIQAIFSSSISSFVENSKYIIHGDLCKSNILINRINRELILLDFEFSVLSSIEFEASRFFSFYFLEYLEDNRINNKETAAQKVFLNYLDIFLKNIDRDFDKKLFIKYLSFHAIKYLFDFEIFFSKIQGRENNIKYFLPYVYKLITNDSEDIVIKKVLDLGIQ